MITKQNKKVTKSTLISFLSLPDIWRRHRWFPREMTSEKFHTGDWLEICLIQSYLGSDASSVWNFRARFSNVISRENHRQRRKMSTVFSGYLSLQYKRSWRAAKCTCSDSRYGKSWVSWLFKTYSAICGSSIYALQLLWVKAFRSLT